MYWQPTGVDSLRVVGTSFYQDAILQRFPEAAQIGSVISTTVLLRQETDNPYDENAVAVVALPDVTLGHLSRENAIRYREAAKKAGIQDAFARAYIQTFKQRGGGTYAPAIELDLDFASLPIEGTLLSDAPTVVSSRSHQIASDHPDETSFRCWLEAPRKLLDKRLRVMDWNKTQDGVHRFTVMHSSGLGVGFNLHEFTADESRSLFGGSEVYAEITDIDGRWATLTITKRRGKELPSLYLRPKKIPFLEFYRRYQLLQSMRLSIPKDASLEFLRDAQQQQFDLHDYTQQKTVDGTKYLDAYGMWGTVTMSFLPKLVNMLLKIGETNEAEEWLTHALERNPELLEKPTFVKLQAKVKEALKAH